MNKKDHLNVSELEPNSCLVRKMERAIESKHHAKSEAYYHWLLESDIIYLL